MKPTLIIIFLLIFKNAAAQTSTVALKVDVLGKKHATVRYYHPIEGLYEINANPVNLNKKALKEMDNFVLIQPTESLTDSINYIQANSLRYYADPAELIYINWAIGNNTKNNSRLDTFKEVSKNLRQNQYQPLVQNYFQPFFISKYEVTNADYREFVDYVKDSLMREAIYSNKLISDEIAANMLIHPTTYYDEITASFVTFNSANRLANRKLFPFNSQFDFWKKIEDSTVVKAIDSLYLRPNERFYKRLEINFAKLNYTYVTIDYPAAEAEKIRSNFYNTKNKLNPNFDLSPFTDTIQTNCYPDTLAWLKGDWTNFNSAFQNMYFWHPAFDNYPVVGISHQQAIAFCHWKQQQLKKSNPTLAAQFEFSLPRTYEYEWATGVYHNSPKNHPTQDNELIANLYLGGEDNALQNVTYNYNNSFTEKVFLPFNNNDPKAVKYFNKRLKKGKIRDAKYKPLTRMRAQQNYLQSGVEFLSNNVSEWMEEDYKHNYEELLKAYINYNCFANPTYCEHQRLIDRTNNNDTTGNLIMGGNWYDERYGNYCGINTAGIYPKAFKAPSNSYATVGFRLVMRLKPVNYNY